MADEVYGSEEARTLRDGLCAAVQASLRPVLALHYAKERGDGEAHRALMSDARAQLAGVVDARSQVIIALVQRAREARVDLASLLPPQKRRAPEPEAAPAKRAKLAD